MSASNNNNKSPSTPKAANLPSSFAAAAPINSCCSSRSPGRCSVAVALVVQKQQHYYHGDQLQQGHFDGPRQQQQQPNPLTSFGCGAEEGSRQPPRAQQQPTASSDEDSGCVMEELYAWVPPSTKPDLVHSYFAALPADKVPRIGSSGEQWRLRQLQRQLPAQDTDAAFCVNLSEQEQRELAAFSRARAEQAAGRGVVKRLPVKLAGAAGDGFTSTAEKLYCHQCKNAIGADQLAIGAPAHFHDRAFWHPGCFVCVECQELLADLVYFKHRDNVFCGRHHAELVKPRCVACDELIFSEECTEAEGKVWHMHHFCCAECGVQLGGRRYVLMQSKNGLHSCAANQPHCLACYRRNGVDDSHDGHQQRQQQPTAGKCSTCRRQIATHIPHIAQGTLRWHADEHCFCCSVCEHSLLGKSYSLCSGVLFCGQMGCSKWTPTMMEKREQQKSAESHWHSRPPAAAAGGHFSSPNLPISPLVSPPRFSPSSSPSVFPYPPTSAFASSPRLPQHNVDKHQKILLVGTPPPPPVPKRSPPPLPPPFCQQEQEENFYETVAATGTLTTTTVIPPSTASTSSGCSTANGSFSSSSSAGCPVANSPYYRQKQQQRHLQLLKQLLVQQQQKQRRPDTLLAQEASIFDGSPARQRRNHQHHQHSVLQSCSSAEDDEDNDCRRDETVVQPDSDRRRQGRGGRHETRRCHSADGRQRQPRTRRSKSKRRKSSRGSAAHHCQQQQQADLNRVMVSLASDCAQKNRQHGHRSGRRPGGGGLYWPNYASAHSSGSSAACSIDDITSTSSSEGEEADDPKGVLLRHYLAAMAQKSAKITMDLANDGVKQQQRRTIEPAEKMAITNRTGRAVTAKRRQSSNCRIS